MIDSRKQQKTRHMRLVVVGSRSDTTLHDKQETSLRAGETYRQVREDH